MRSGPREFSFDTGSAIVTCMIVSGERRLAHQELLERAARVASGLNSLGIIEGDTIALCLRNDFPYLKQVSVLPILAGALLP
jgi:long-chain acyl-CoA synthetase